MKKILLFGIFLCVTAMSTVDARNGIKEAGLKKAISEFVVFEDSEQAVKDNFRKKLDRVLPEDSLLMEVRDEEDTVHIYGTVDEDASVVKNLILYVPGDCVLLYLEGKLSIDSLAQIAF